LVALGRKQSSLLSIALRCLLTLCFLSSAYGEDDIDFRFTLDTILSGTTVNEKAVTNPGNILLIDEFSNLIRFTAEAEGDMDGLVHLGINVRATADSDGENDTEVREGWISVGTDISPMIKIGKQKVAWGKGYIWNPVDYINIRKNALDFDDPVAGRTMVYVDIPFADTSISGVYLPDPEDDTPEANEFKDALTAVRVSSLLHDTDIALVAGWGPENEKKIGISLSQPLYDLILTFEASWSTYPLKRYYTYTPIPLVEPYYEIFEDEYKLSAVLGFNYQMAGGNGFLVGEIYYDEAGYNKEQMEAYHDFCVLASQDLAVAALMGEELISLYEPARMGQWYAYLSYTHTFKDDYTAGCSVISNLNDSFSYIIPSFSYTGVTDVDMRLEVLIPAGHTGKGEGSLYPTHSTVALWLTVYF
jgi:hypothetical protein